MTNKRIVSTQNLRYPTVAGQFYPANKQQLIQALEDSIQHHWGAQIHNNKNSIKKVKKLAIAKKNIAGIAPHAGYIYSGPCQSHTYAQLVINSEKATYLILGLSHHGYKTCLSDQNFMTPLGVVGNNKELLEIIKQQTSIKIDNQAHQFEHSIEVQLPFLQYYSDKQHSIPDFVPLIIGQEKYEDIEKIAKNIAIAIQLYQKKTKKQVKIIVSSDFVHYGKDYGYTPQIDSTKSTKETIEIIDKTAIELILKKDSKQLYQFYKNTKATICGVYPIIVLLKILQMIHPNTKGVLESYYTSSQIIPRNSDASVSYASITFKIDD